MAVDHHVGLRLGQFLGRLALLGFLREDAHPPTREIFDQPGVVDVDPCVAFAAPATPAQATPFTFSRWENLQNLRFYRKSKGLEVETHTVFQLGPLAVAETDVR